MKRFLYIIIMSLFVAEVCAAREPRRGYRGFVEWDNAFGNVDCFDSATGETKRDYALFTGFATTHGYQFNNHCYLGAGVGLPLLMSLNLMLPVYADFRYDVKFGKFSPFADFKIGCNLLGLSAYISPTIGYRIDCGPNTKTNINIGLGLNLLHRIDEHKVGISHPYDPTNYPYMYKTVTTHHFDPLLTFRIGVDF